MAKQAPAPINTKPPAYRAPSDALTIMVDGEAYHPHAGESVWFRHVGNMKGLYIQRLLNKLQRLGLEGSALGDPADEGYADRMSALDADMDETFGELSEHLASTINRWDWTDDDGEAMPQPDAEVIRDLRREEIGWLIAMQSTRSGVPASDDGRKNSSSGTISPLKARATRSRSG